MATTKKRNGSKTPRTNKTVFSRKQQTRTLEEINDPELKDMVKNSLIDELREPRMYRIHLRLPLLGMTAEWLTSEELHQRVPQMAPHVIFMLDRIGDSLEYKSPTTDYEFYARRVK